MIVGLGTDIVEIERISGALERRPRFAERILCPVELARYREVRDPARFLAKRFAAKEAAVKALGTGIGRGIGWQQFSIESDGASPPQLRLSGFAADVAKQRGISRWLISYSDERHYVVATVMACAS
ncbi:holo-ACP synthase [Marinobacterium litorale]|uniref:holo-ACP synthase n=1 Tax=Marinobacterium litorale TaxID=404770 RepID=UPI000422AC73|nr:holo-ACP synthase [Marinobacterium litorale]